VIANLKHYVANEQELARQSSSSNMDERTFKQIYDLPYEIAVRKSDPGSLMCSYNQVNGAWACENEILTTSLREDYPFQGYVMSDFGSVHSTAPSLNAGLLELPAGSGEPSKRLIGWERVTLEPGEHRNVQVTLSAVDLADMHLLEYWDTAASAWTTAPGTYTVTVGGSVSADAEASFSVK
jgi:hypothetical protein